MPKSSNETCANGKMSNIEGRNRELTEIWLLQICENGGNDV